MFQSLLDRLRHPASRARELARLRSLFAQMPAADDPGASPEEAQLASELRRLREELSRALGEVQSCRGCARGHPLPFGRWTGGHCCGGRTENLFTEHEVAALKLGGTTPAQLTPPRSDHCGCTFRGPTGCTLQPGDRPNVCVRYFCAELTEELRGRGDFADLRALCTKLDQTFDRFVAVRSARLSDEELARLISGSRTGGGMANDGP